jgi:hypothetical protein
MTMVDLGLSRKSRTSPQIMKLFMLKQAHLADERGHTKFLLAHQGLLLIMI